MKRSSAAGSLAKQAKLDLAKDDDKSGKAVGRTSGSSSGEICSRTSQKMLIVNAKIGRIEI